ncbi:hypothetical protein JWG40_12200 [Leptospira sp. 201903074]|uniref:hypothetical protein n=1 Tax=Leptospira abararensis TaxID=2810036 RepID=UPI0019650E72|nr:hypothetical protein [Leptospira abararensis]MBM9547785.1 hypothetical protein [Leptospira abararensis]
MKDYIEILEYFIPRRKTKYGLLAMLLVATITFFTIFNTIDWISKVMSLFSIYSSIILFWYLDSYRLILPHKKIIIGITLRSLDAKSQSIINKTIVKIREHIQTINLDNTLKIIEIGSDVFSSNEEAEKYARKKNISAILHGNIMQGKINGNIKYDFRNFFWSCYFGKEVQNDKNSIQRIYSDIILFLETEIRDFLIDESNNLEDLNRVSQALANILISLTGILLSLSNEKIEISAKIIESILPLFESKLTMEQRKILYFPDQKKVNISINLLKSGRLRTILISCYLIVANRYLFQNKHDLSRNYFNKAINSNIYPTEAHIGLALLYYKEGNLKESKKHTLEINRIDPENYAFYINMAFFSVLEKKYRDAISYYHKLKLNIKEPQTYQLNFVINFLKTKFEENSNEFAFLYLIGFLNWFFANRFEGGRYLEEFIKSAEGIKIYKEMKADAKDILKHH